MKNSKGSVLAVALSMMFLFSGLGIGALNYAGMQGQFATNQIISSQAFWMAEAGAQDSLAKLKLQIRDTLNNNVVAATIAEVSKKCDSYVATKNP